MKKDPQSICPITYETLKPDEKYSARGLKLLSPRLITLKDLPFTAEQQRIEARLRANKMSIQGVQPKLSAILDLKTQSFEICNGGGKFILKPPSELYPELPENEDLTMRLAAMIRGISGIEVPLHGLIYGQDKSLTYFIKRFDRLPRGRKVSVEDFGQLAGLTRDTKYDFTMEKIVAIMDKYCSFPALEKSKLFSRIIFNFLIGNEDMHLKNFSLISRDNKVELSPAYDFLNTTIALGNATEEFALSIHGKKNNLKRNDIVEYYGQDRLGLNQKLIEEILAQFKAAIPHWQQLIEISFLSDKGKNEYFELLGKRINILHLIQ